MSADEPRATLVRAGRATSRSSTGSASGCRAGRSAGTCARSTALRVADFGCGFEATFARRVLDRASRAPCCSTSRSTRAEGRSRRSRRSRARCPDALPASTTPASTSSLCIVGARAPVGAAAGARRDAPASCGRAACASSTCPRGAASGSSSSSAFRLGLSPADEMNDHKRYYDPRDLWPMLVAGRVPPAGHHVPPPQVRPQHVRGLPRRPEERDDQHVHRRPSSTRRGQILDALDVASVEAVAAGLAAVRARGGRLFILGVGGSAGHAGHAVNDFRKLCGFEAYAPTDNVSELTARTNDEGWDTTFSAWLEGSRLGADDAVLVFSVGGGDARAQRLGQHRAGRSSWRRRSAPASSASSAATAATPPRSPTPAS